MHHSYDDLQLHDIINTENVPLFFDKFNRFKSIFTDIELNFDSHSNNNNNTFYNDWIDISLEEIKKLKTKNHILSDKRMDQFIYDLLHLYMKHQQYVNNGKSDQELIQDLVFQIFGYSKARQQTLDQLYPTKEYFTHTERFDNFSKSLSIISMTEILNQPLKVKFRSFKDIIDDPFFIENKERFRSLDYWSDQEFVNSLLDGSINFVQDKEKLNLLKWILTISPHFNYDLYIQHHQNLNVDQISFGLLYKIKIILNNNTNNNNNHDNNSYDNNNNNNNQNNNINISSAFQSPQLFKFISKYYSQELNHYVISKFHLMINDCKTLNLFVKYWLLQKESFEKRPLSKISINAINPDIELLKLIVENNLLIFMHNVKLTKQHIDYLLVHRPSALNYSLGLFEGDDDIDPFQVWKKVNLVNGTDGLSNIYDVFWEAVIQGRLDFIQSCVSSFTSTPNRNANSFLPGMMFRDQCIISAYDSEFIDIYKYLLDLWYDGQRSERVILGLFRSDLTRLKIDRLRHTLLIDQSIDEKIKQTIIKRYFLDIYSFLSFSSKQEKGVAIEIVELIKEIYLEKYNNHPLVYEPQEQLKLTLYQDSRFYIQLKHNTRNARLVNCSKQQFLREALVGGSLNEAKFILDSVMNQDDLEIVTNNIDLYLKSFLYQIPNPKLKVFLYLFDRFQSIIQPQTISIICSLALKSNNYQLLDILLHRTKIRLLAPLSNQHDKSMLCSNIIDIIKSPYYNPNNIYFIKYPITNLSLINLDLLENYQPIILKESLYSENNIDFSTPISTITKIPKISKERLLIF
ncbi:hypothetical protein CYY_004145 [Polysphondylium violaceum]|uniref:Uncharacterized protein n=1 Tax=Polysphondylium violaceum TaxID=133409 RepID=A0A8J4V0L5_9MYCE|nr:hypothetical protein CYY_004145 [Polysphondylium violaceum]